MAAVDFFVPNSSRISSTSRRGMVGEVSAMRRAILAAAAIATAVMLAAAEQCTQQVNRRFCHCMTYVWLHPRQLGGGLGVLGATQDGTCMLIVTPLAFL